MTMRRFTDHKAAGFPKMLDQRHPAVTDGTTLYPARIAGAETVARVLIPGENSRKIGGICAKGRWRGMPIYTLTLEERATCPRSCGEWSTCYGNKMNWSTRLRSGPELEAALDRELCHLSRQESGGFIVRLHVLGDFYSPEYVHLWGEWVKALPQLHIFGYTAWGPKTPIGASIAKLRYDEPERFWVRFSGQPIGSHLAAKVLDRVVTGPLHEGGIVCPAQTGATECCGTCALCWTTEKEIVFLRH